MTTLLMLTTIASWGSFARLDCGVGAREVAMGATGVASCRNSAAAYWNPGALAMLDAGNLTVFSPGAWPLGFGYSEPGDFAGFASFALPVTRGIAAGAAVDRLSIGGIEARTGETVVPVCTLAYYETAAWLGGAVEALPGLGVGLGLALYNQQLSGTTAALFSPGVNFGCHYTAADWLRFGVTARTASFFVGATDAVKSRVSLGAAADPVPGLTVAVDVWRYPDGISGNFGAEYRLGTGQDVEDALPLGVAFRAGLRGLGGERWDEAAPTGGLGLDIRTASFEGAVDIAVVGHPLFGPQVGVGLTVGY